VIDAPALSGVFPVLLSAWRDSQRVFEYGEVGGQHAHGQLFIRGESDTASLQSRSEQSNIDIRAGQHGSGIL
jgi:hypothetical protein